MLLGVLLVGAAVGAAITRAVDKRMGRKGDEPMVPPVYTLPPVSAVAHVSIVQVSRYPGVQVMTMTMTPRPCSCPP
jgi:hypothetical protein